jgi:hypothetical protein
MEQLRFLCTYPTLRQGLGTYCTVPPHQARRVSTHITAWVGTIDTPSKPLVHECHSQLTHSLKGIRNLVATRKASNFYKTQRYEDFPKFQSSLIKHFYLSTILACKSQIQRFGVYGYACKISHQSFIFRTKKEELQNSKKNRHPNAPTPNRNDQSNAKSR